MKVLELYSGNEWGKSVFKEFGFEVISCRLDIFDYSIRPRDGFDIVFININGNHLGLYDDIDLGDLEFALDAVEYYEPKYWIINHTNKKVWDDIMVWGLPYQQIQLMRGGKLIPRRVWTNISKWEPKYNKIYFKETYILLELLEHI